MPRIMHLHHCAGPDRTAPSSPCGRLRMPHPGPQGGAPRKGGLEAGRSPGAAPGGDRQVTELDERTDGRWLRSHGAQRSAQGWAARRRCCSAPHSWRRTTRCPRSSSIRSSAGTAARPVRVHRAQRVPITRRTSSSPPRRSRRRIWPIRVADVASAPVRSCCAASTTSSSAVGTPWSTVGGGMSPRRWSHQLTIGADVLTAGPIGVVLGGVAAAAWWATRPHRHDADQY